MKPFLIVMGIINAVCVATLILFITIQVSSFGMWFYRWQFDANATYARVNMEPDDLHEVVRHMIRYMQGREADLQIMTVVGGEARYFFSPIEIRHMIDVYDLFAVGFVVQYVVVGLLLVTSMFFVSQPRVRRRYLYMAWQWVSAGVFALFAGLVVAILINWHRAFVIFHEIFFDNDYWILNPRVDLLLNIVPYEFFMTLSAFIAIVFVLGLVGMFLVGFFILRSRAFRRIF